MSYYQSDRTLINDIPARQFINLQYAAGDEIRRVQDQLLREHLLYLAASSPWYRTRLAGAGIDPEAIRTLDDLPKLPLTEKTELLEHNQQFLASDPKSIVDICLTSATSGTIPAMLLQTQSDLARLAYNEEVAFAMAGIEETDTLLICAALDRAFMAGLAYFLGGVKLNARMVRSGAGSAAQHWHLIKVSKATALVGVPSLMRRIAEYALEIGENPGQSTVQKLIAIGEPTRDKNLQLLPLTARLESMWNAEIYSTYASTELATTFCECPVRQGGHLRPELIITEILDEKGQPVPEGQTGEVVVTPLGVTGMPLLRFRTGDMAYLLNAPCACGRTTARLSPILGRRQQMLKYKGTTIFPNTILSALEGHPLFDGGYVEAHCNDDGTDRIRFFVAVKDAAFTAERIESELQARLRVVPEVIVCKRAEVEAKTDQPDKKRKRVTFFDLR